MRPSAVRVDVTEAQYAQAPATGGDRRQTGHVLAPLVAIERVKQPAVEHRLEHSAELLKVQGVGKLEVSGNATSGGLLPRERQCRLSHIDADYDASHGRPARRS